jgi:hypothetical protein
LKLEKKVLIAYCDCTDEDYECDVGYEREGLNGPCMPIDKSEKHKENISKPPENCNGYYPITKGYRKIPGNACKNGQQYEPILVACPNQGIFSSLGVLFTALIIVTVILLIIIAFNKNFFKDVSEIVKERMKDNQKGSHSYYKTGNTDYSNIVNIVI